MDILNLNFTGHLTEDAKKSVYEKEDEKNEVYNVYNFTVAVNLNKNNVVYLKCNHWQKLKETEVEVDNVSSKRKTLEDFLKKGRKITVYSKYFKNTKYQSESSGKIHENIEITVEKMG